MKKIKVPPKPKTSIDPRTGEEVCDEDEWVDWQTAKYWNEQVDKQKEKK